VNALLALWIGAVVGLVAHKLAGDEPLTSEPEYVGHLFAELLIVVLAALIAYWLLEDIQAARRKPR
jgi:Na+/H+-dicarboxylate symporter